MKRCCRWCRSVIRNGRVKYHSCARLRLKAALLQRQPRTSARSRAPRLHHRQSPTKRASAGSGEGGGEGGDDDGGDGEGAVRLLAVEQLRHHPLSVQIYGLDVDPAFVEGIKAKGIREPLQVIRRDDGYRVLSGNRRLVAAQQLGLDKVPAYILDIPEAAELSHIIECNHRHERTFSQRLREAEALEPILAEDARQRMLAGRGPDGSGGRGRRSADQSRAPRTRDALARYVGLGSGVQLERLQKIAQERPDLLPEIDAGRRTIGGAWNELRRAEKRERDAQLAAQVLPRADVLQADCRETLPTLADGRFAAIITDAPYGLSAEGEEKTAAGFRIRQDFGSWDHLSDEEAQALTDSCAQEFFRVSKPGGALYLFPGDRFLPFWVLALKRVGFILPRPYLLAWVKTNPPPSVRRRGWRSATEPIIYALKPGPDTFNFLSDEEMASGITCPLVHGTKRLHPTEKPVELIERLIRVSTSPGDEVLDPFAGSGSTGEAAIRTKRHALLIERDPTFHALATKRIHGVEGQVKPKGKIG